ncbi:Nucleotidyltransferase [Mycena amicta]|nr:Nucleotidyltransferase [Mycena amicta]
MATDIPSRRRKPRENPSRNDATSGDFEDGTDFIRLDAESDSDDRHSSRTGKEREAPRERSRSHSPPSKRRRESEDNLEPRGHRRERDHENDNVREWDRGKRKYDMVFDFNEASHSKKRRTEPTERFTPWIDGVDWENCKSPAEMFHREVESFVKWISPSPQEDEIRGLVVEIISRFVTSQFPDAQVLPFGSFATKLYLPAGDIDLVIRSQSMAYSSTSNVLSSLASVIRRSGLTDGKVTIIAKAKVPIVKFVTSAEYGHFNVDISINQESGLESGRIINNFLRDFGGTSGACLALRALVLLTKLFLAQRQMNEVYTGGLGSYAIVCLCISFLQMHPKVRFGQIDPDNNLGVLVIEFFELYGHRFHYDEVGISLRNGGCYFGKRQRGWGSWGGNRRGSSLSIEDPGDPSNDISSGSYNFYNVRQNLAGAHDLLLTAVYTKAGILAARKSGTAKLLRDGYDARDMSILSAMLGVDQKASCPPCTVGKP